MTRKLTAEDIALLNEAQIANVATVNADGTPQVTPVWIDTDGEAVLFNTGKHRIKYRNLERTGWAAVSVVDKADFYRTVNVKGRVEIIEEGADAHIDRLAKKYLGADTYPWRKATETRVIVRVVPE